MQVVAVDVETLPIMPGRICPPLVCMSVSTLDGHVELLEPGDARQAIEKALRSGDLIVGHNIAFDLGVFCANFPVLIPLIFKAYEENRITCTEIREKLIHLAEGRYHWPNGRGAQRCNYSLAEVAEYRLGVTLDKSWQMRFGEFYDVPHHLWPEGAIEYALADAVCAVEIYQMQERDAHYLKDQFRQARAAFWLQLMSSWGLKTNPEGVEEFARKTQRKFDVIAEELMAAGLMRPNGVRNMKAVQQRVASVYERAGKRVERTAPTRRAPEGNIITDADVCERSGDAILEKYANFSSLKKTLSTDIPLLRQGCITPIRVRYEVLLETGRTSSSPNVQNLPTEEGVRECFAPRPGWVFISADYSSFELRTWSQVCLKVLGFSKMAEYLNAGKDPHCEIASRILEISYEQAVEEYAKDPKGRVYNPRQTGKVANFGLPGGLGCVRLVDYARTNYGVILDLSFAEELRDVWRESWPESRAYHEWVNRMIDTPNPQILQLASQRYRGDVSFTEAANSLFQGLAADAAKNAGFLIAKACYAEPASSLYGCRPVNFVHDEFIVEAPEEQAADAAEELARLMVVGASPFLPDVPPKAEPMVSRKWSKKAKPVRDASGRLIPWAA